ARRRCPPIRTRAHAIDPCAGAGAPMASTWNPARARSIDAVSRARIDRYASSWIDARGAACRDTQSAAMLDRRDVCLDRARAQLDAIVGELPRDPAHAGELLALLPALDACANVTSLAGETPLPADPDARARIDGALRVLAVADMHTIRLDLAPRDAQALADEVVARAKETRWPPVIAEATRLRGSLLIAADRLDDGRAALEEAASLGLSSGDEDAGARALADLAWSLSSSGRHAEARRAAALAEGTWRHMGSPPDLGVRIAMAQANAAFVAGDVAAGLDASQRAAALAERAYDDPYDRSATHMNLAIAYDHAGRTTDAAREIDRALAIRRPLFGPDHVAVADLESEAAVIAFKQGRTDDAIALARHAADVDARAYGERSLPYAEALSRLAGMLGQLGRLDDAAPILDRALAIHRALDPAGEHAGMDEANLAVIEAQRGNLELALDHGTRALASLEQLWGADNPRLSDGLILIGYCQRGLGRTSEAIAANTRAVALIEKARGADHPTVVNARIELSYSLAAAGRTRDALAALAPAIALVDRNPDVPPSAAAEARAAYAKLLAHHE
ncbi:MAG TPA: tetratricopeptide repeat protein, partial [Kofleriaceae bacterium]|nr:tetratricopeptide repeat protein [Kofleriaceae bacterium]